MLKYHEICLLEKTEFKNEMQEKHDGLKIQFYIKNCKMIVEGLIFEVQDVRLKMYEQKDLILSYEVKDFSNERQNFLKREEITKYVQQQLDAKNILAVWAKSGSTLHVYSYSDESLVMAVKLLQLCIAHNTIPITVDAKSLLMSSKWTQLTTSLKKAEYIKFPFEITNNEKELEIVATDADDGLLVEKIRDFLATNTITEVLITLSPHVSRFVSLHASDKISSIVRDLKSDQVKICSLQGSISIRGTDVGLSKSKMKIQQMLDSVKTVQHTLEKPGIRRIMTSNEGRDKIMRVESNFLVTLEQKDLSEEHSTEDLVTSVKDSQRGKLVREVARCIMTRYEVNVMLGDATELPVDVLVNSANRQLRHDGGLAKAIVAKGKYRINNCSSIDTSIFLTNG